MQLAREAGALLLRHRDQGFTVEYKTSPDDPVTVADHEASVLIVAGLRASFADDGILSEELADTAERLNQKRVWIIDPIDGTQEYTRGLNDYSVSIGLVVAGEPVVGVVFAPSLGTDSLGVMYSGVVGQGLSKNGVPAGLNTALSAEQARISVSDSEYTRELRALGLPNMQPSGSIALKLAKIATGDQEATFTMSPRSEWDIAAGHALLRAAGGELRRRDGQPIVYNRPDPQIEQGIIGGRHDVVAHLEAELLRLRVPLHHLGVLPGQSAYRFGPSNLAPDQSLHVRYSGDSLLALVILRGQQVISVQGGAADVQVLMRDLRRAYGVAAHAIQDQAIKDHTIKDIEIS